MSKFKMIPFIGAENMPDEVIDYCGDREISTHYQNDVAFVKDDGNPLAEWLKEIEAPRVKQKEMTTAEGRKFKDPWYDWAIAISAT